MRDFERSWPRSLVGRVFFRSPKCEKRCDPALPKVPRGLFWTTRSRARARVVPLSRESAALSLSLSLERQAWTRTSRTRAKRVWVCASWTVRAARSGTRPPREFSSRSATSASQSGDNASNLWKKQTNRSPTGVRQAWALSSERRYSLVCLRETSRLVSQRDGR